MELTPQRKAEIDKKSYEELLRGWRFGKTGDKWFQGATGEYWSERMSKLRDTVDHVAISKKIGWKGRK